MQDGQVGGQARTLPYFRRRDKAKLRALHSRSSKEIVRSVTLGVAAGVTTAVVLADSVNDYTGTIGTCPIGSKISRIHLQVSYQSTQATSNQADWYVAKDPGGGLPLPVPASTGGNANRKWIFHESTGINPDDDGFMARKEGWLEIPKKMQRMGEGDQIELRFNAAGIYDLCIKCIYKWYA